MLPLKIDFRLTPSQRAGATSSEPPRISRNTVEFGKKVRLIKKIPEKIKTYEEDFLLEKEGDIRSFFDEANSPGTPGVRYNDKGKIIPYSIIGPASLFENQPNVPKYSPLPSYSLPSSPLGIFKFGFPLVRKQLLKIDHEKKFKDRLAQIEEVKKSSKAKEKETLKALSLEEKIKITKEQRALRQFQRMQEKWDHIDEGLCKRIQKHKEELLPTRACEYREKLEELDIIDKVRSLDKSNKYHWYMSLRGDPRTDKLDAIVNVGNFMTGLYTRIRQRSSSQSIIRKPGTVKANSKTFRDDPYFKDTAKNGEIYSSLSQARNIKCEELNVIGLSKLPMEIDAVKSAGYENLKLEAIEKGDEEEIIVENYAPRIRAFSTKTTIKY
ncbi:unnamed protein product [Blepharisma stoltei]|uniref:Uncharacterized protein n=1 Tax=Blepharisma stoltei TaxID=1481888 RepID=A0AAU9KCY7_9CILI|nr:unnamed protein product [Blepharisma stoltei]